MSFIHKWFFKCTYLISHIFTYVPQSCNCLHLPAGPMSQYFSIPPFNLFVVIVILCCSTEGKDKLIPRTFLRKHTAMEKPFLKRPPTLHRWVLNGVNPFADTTRSALNISLVCQFQLKNTCCISPLSVFDGNHVCHTVRPAREYLRWPLALCFLLEDFHVTQSMSIV